MVWPPQSPDLNPIEAMWDYVDSKLKKTERTSQEVMWQNLQKAWNSIPRAVLRKYIFSMRNRSLAVIRARGGHTKYQRINAVEYPENLSYFSLITLKSEECEEFSDLVF